MSIRRFTALSCMVVAMAAPVSAQSPAPLSSEEVKQFLDSLQDIEKLGEQYDLKKPARANPSLDAKMERGMAPFSAVANEARAMGAHADLLAAVTRHGFRDLEAWSTTGDRIMRAAVALQMSTRQPELQAAMAKARKDLEASGLPKAQQEAMLKMMQSSTQAMEMFGDVSEADKQAVAPHLERLKDFGEK